MFCVQRNDYGCECDSVIRCLKCLVRLRQSESVFMSEYVTGYVLVVNVVVVIFSILLFLSLLLSLLC